MNLKNLLFLFAFLSTVQAFATHNRAGEITYRQIDVLTIEATVTTYTKATSVDADRDTVDICWGDGSCSAVIRVNGPDTDNNGISDGELLENNIRLNKYTTTYTYGGIGHYMISMQDPNRNADICNVNFPNPDGVPFFIFTTVTLFNSQDNGYNSSPILTETPIDIACIDQPFFHNPGAYDPDGDSLSYHLVQPFQGPGLPVDKYVSPALPPNSITINPTSGDLWWISPEPPCNGAEYNIAFIIVEHRNGIPFDTLLRDMQVRVLDCNNLPPVIDVPEEICVIAGERIELTVGVSAPASDSTQKVKVVASGRVFDLDDPAIFETDSMFYDDTLKVNFIWQTNCNHISNTDYQIIFRATDDFPIIDGTLANPDTVFLTSLKVLRIKVVGPQPRDVQAEPEKDKITVSWEKPYDCEVTEDEYFRGFTVWRKIGTNPFPLDTCDPGLEGKGYTRISPTLQDMQAGRYFFVDEDVERGRTYCYRILGEFAQLTPIGGFPFNKVQSLPSDELCVQLSRDVPLITKVSVLTTDQTAGSIDVHWTKPLPEDLDTLLNPGPYVYELWRAPGLNPADADFSIVAGATFSSPTFSEANDTIFTDNGLNTLDQPYSYRLAFYVDNEVEPLGFSATASSVYLGIVSTDERNELSWSANVPWENYSYIVYRQNTSGTWEEIATTLIPEYKDLGLTNGQEYCYYVNAEGSYGVENIISPLFNDSQEKCGTPLDTIPPCPPAITIDNICNSPIPAQTCLADDLDNTINWNNVNISCDEADDVVGYNIYYAEFSGGEFEFVGSTGSATATQFIHKPNFGLAGCYAVTAFDEENNESEYSNIECPDNCPNYQLPNVFTPNQDGSNDLFVPFPYCFIESVDFRVFNRWGQLVYVTSDPDLNWDGKNLKGSDVVEGTYYYSCRVLEQRVAGIVESPEILSGYIELVRGE